jgi:metallo-beta-lactamase family protein
MNALTFLGAAGTVTGSKFLLEYSGVRLLLDCGLFQGFKPLRLRNWAHFPVDVRTLDAILLSHAHIDHSGYLPLLAREGFRGPIWCTPATRDLCEILLKDSAFLQEREAEFANRYGFSKHKPALPLYTVEDAERALKLLRVLPFNKAQQIGSARVTFRAAGHIPGAAITEIESAGRRIVFSGDLGRPNDPLMVAPSRIEEADYLLVESTYGNRRHLEKDVETDIADIVARTVARGGSVIIPAFAVGRTQVLLHHLHRLKAEKRIPDIPIFLDSPMAIDATEIFCASTEDWKLSHPVCAEAFRVAHYVRDVAQSKALDNNLPKILISASGMATGGRILHHLKYYAPDPRHTLLFAGFQAGGTRGATITGGADWVKIHGQHVPIRAEVRNLEMLSAHADGDELMDWLRGFKRAPTRCFVVHGEPSASDALRLRIEEELGWTVEVPEQGERAELS